jgi:hypothetical protein
MSILWDESVEKFRKVTDRLGCPIDAGIFDTVVALNILGVHTTMSCEGHLDHGLAYPWIDTPIDNYHKLSDLLTAFYSERITAFDRRIIIISGAERCRIQSQGSGGGFLNLVVIEDRPHKLSEYQSEMRAFTEFLKSIYFSREE